MSEKWSKEFDSCFQVGSIEEIADALEKRSGSEENALAMLAMTAFTRHDPTWYLRNAERGPGWQRHSAGANRLQGK